MNIAFNTLVDNPIKPTGSLVFFTKILEEFSRIDDRNQYFVLVSPTNRHLFKIHKNNFHYVNCYYSQDKKYRRIFFSQFIIPFRLLQHKIDVYFIPQNISPFIIPNKCKVIINLYGTHHWKDKNYLGEIRTIYRKIISILGRVQATKFIANSKSCQKDIIENLHIPETKVQVIMEALDHNIFNTDPLSEKEIEKLKEKKLTPNKYFLFVSIIYYYKNIHTLIKAFSEIYRLFPEYSLVFIGRIDLYKGSSREYYQKIKKMIINEQIEHQVIFLDYIPHEHLSVFYKGAKLYIQPSFYETFGKTVIEAMACGTPVIGANTGATPEVINNAGLLFDPNSSKDLTRKIKSILVDIEMYKKLRKLGIMRAKEFTFKKQAASLLNIFEESVKKV